MKQIKHIVKLFRNSLLLDYKYIFPVLSNEELKYLSEKLKESTFSSIYILKGVVSFSKGFFKSIKDISCQKRKSLKKTKFIFYSDSKNNDSVLFPVKDKLNSSVIISFKKNDEFKMSRFLVYLISFGFLPVVIYRFHKTKGGLKKAYKNRFQYFWLSYGYYIYFHLLLKKCKNQIIVMANDHESKARILRIVASQLKITTIYVQHASISPYFPPLDFDYAFLDGQDALNKYLEKGCFQTIVFLTGSAKYDLWFKAKNRNRTIKRIGICTNTIDSIQKTHELILFIKNSFSDVTVSLRPHPGDKRFDKWKHLAEDVDVVFNNSQDISTFSFLNIQDAIIASESNIHLEAAILNVIPIYYNLQGVDIYSDVYGFSKAGLVYDCKESLNKITEVLSKYIKDKPNVFFKTKMYLDIVNTKFEGESSLLMCKLINEIFEKNIDLSIWEKCLSIKEAEVYKLKKTNDE